MVDFEADMPTPEATEEGAATAYAATSPDLTAALGSLALGTTRVFSNAAQRGTFADASVFDRASGRGMSDDADPGLLSGAETSYAPPALPSAPLLDADTINKQFGPQGPDGKQIPITDKPMSEGLAQVIAKQKSDAMERDAVWSRYAENHNVVTNLGVGAVGFMLDPLNVGSMFVPGIGEEAILGGIGRAGFGATSIAARAAARFGAGATAGVVQMAPIAAAKYVLGTEEASDYDLRAAFKDVAFGAGLGAMAHAVPGLAREAATATVGPERAATLPFTRGLLAPDDLMKAEGGPAYVPPPPIRGPAYADPRVFTTGALPFNYQGRSGSILWSPPEADIEAIRGATLEQRQAAIRSSVSQIVDGREVDVSPIIQTSRPGADAGAADPMTLDPSDYQNRVAARARALDPQAFQQADTIDNEIAVQRAQLDRVLQTKAALEAGTPDLARERIAALESELSEARNTRVNSQYENVQALRNQVDAITGKRRSSPRASDLRNQLANAEQGINAPLPSDHPETLMQAEIDRLRGQGGDIRAATLQKVQDDEVRARLNISDAVQRRGAAAPRVNAARSKAEAEAIAMGFSPRLRQQVAKVARPNEDVTVTTEHAAVERMPKEIRDAVFSESAPAGRGHAENEGRGPGNVSQPEGGPAIAGERLRPAGESGDGPIEPGPAAPAGTGASLAVAGGPSAPGSRVFYGSRSLAVRHELAEAAALTTSHTADFRVNPAYPSELQPRDRAAVPARNQVNAIAAGLQPERLGPSPEANFGTPIVGPDNVVESGNGRTMAIRQAYATGGERAAAYRAYLERMGYDTTGMRHPVLIARRLTDLTPEQRAEFGHMTAASEAQRLGTTETALSDSRAITPDLSEMLKPGDVASLANRDFVRAFIAKLPPGEAAGMMTANGTLSAQGVVRLRAAVTARAYGDESVIARAFESRDSNIKSIASALTDGAADWIKMREAVERGEIPAGDDVTDDVMRTVQTIMRARDEGERISDAFRQSDMFASGLPQQITRFFFKGDDYGRFYSADVMGDNLSTYARDLVSGATKGQDMFGNSAPGAGDVLGGLIDRNRGRAASLEDSSPMPTASDLAQQQAAVRRDGFAPGIPQDEFNQVTDRLYGPKADEPAAAPPKTKPTVDAATGQTVDPEMQALERRVLSAPALSDLDRQAIAAANDGIADAAARGEAYTLAGDMLSRGETLGEAGQLQASLRPPAPIGDQSQDVLRALSNDPRWKGEWNEDRVWKHIRDVFPDISDERATALAERVEKDVKGEPVEEAAAHTTYKPGDVSFPSDDAVTDDAYEHEEHQGEDSDGRSYSYTLSFVKDGDTIHAVVSDIVAHNPAGEEVSIDGLGRVQAYKIRKAVKDVAQGQIGDHVEQETENARWDSLSEEQQHDEIVAQQDERARADQEKTEAINKVVDAAVDSGWRPQVNEYGGWKRPDEFKPFASPESQAKIRARLEERGLSLERPKFPDDVAPKVRAPVSASNALDELSKAERSPRLTVETTRGKERLTAAQADARLSHEQSDLQRIDDFMKGKSDDWVLARMPEERLRSSLENTKADIERLTVAKERFKTYKPDGTIGRPFSRSKVLDAGDRYVATMATDERHDIAPDRKVFKIYDKPAADPTVARRPSKEFGAARGQVDIARGADGRWEVQMVEVAPGSRGKGVATALYGAVQKELGIEMSPSGILLPDGYAFWKNRAPEKVQWHTQVGDNYLSPKRLGLLSRSETLDPERVATYKAAFDALPPAAKSDAAMQAMFSLRHIRENEIAARPADVSGLLRPEVERAGNETVSYRTVTNYVTGEKVVAQDAAPLSEMMQRFDVSDDPAVDQLARASHAAIGDILNDRIGDMKVYTVDFANMRKLTEGRIALPEGYSVGGFYDPVTHHLAVLDDALRDPVEGSRLLVHEGLHGAFFRTIERSENARGVVDQLRDAAMAAHIGRGGAATDHYGLTNAHEFVAEAFSNPEFQRFLATIPADARMVKAFGLDQAPGQSMWDMFVGAVRRILGFAPGQHSLLDASMRLGLILDKTRMEHLSGRWGGDETPSLSIRSPNMGRIEAAVAARGKLGPGEARTLIREVADRAEQMRATGAPDPFVSAAKELADKIQDTARKDKLDALRNAEARTKIMTRIDAAGGMGSAAEQLRSMLHGTYKSGLDSVQSRHRGLASSWQAALSHKLHAAGLEKAAISGAMDEDIAKDLWSMNAGGGEGSGNKLARQAAEAIHPVLEEIKNRLNGLGARIGDATDYVATTRHDPYKMRRAAGSGRNTPDEAFAAWWKDTQPLLADKTFDNLLPRDGETTQQARDRFGRSAFDSLVSGVHMTADSVSGVKFDPNGGAQSGSAFEGTRNLAKKVSQDRTLFWKDGPSWNSYVQKYGNQTSLADGVMRTVNQAAKQISLMERFGTNPMANLSMIERAIAERGRSDFDGLKRFQGQMNGVRNVMAYLDGSANIPANADWAAIGNNIRTFYSVADLGGVGVTHFASIWPTVTSEMRHHGMSRLEGLGQMAGALVKGKGSAERQEIMADLGAYADGLTRDMSANWQPDSPQMGRMSSMANTFMKYTGIHYVFDNTQAAVRSMLSHNLARNLSKDFGALEPHLQGMLSSYGLGEPEWNLLRSVDDLKTENGRAYLTPRDVLRIDPAMLEEHLRATGALEPTQGGLDLGDGATDPAATATAKLAQGLADKLGAYFSDVSAHSTVTAGARERAMLLGGTRAGSLSGEAMRFIMQFKMWPVAAYDQLLRREIQMSTSKADAVWGIGSMMALSAASGYLRMTINDTALGRPVRNPLDWQTAFAGLAQGGGAGILGDFLFGEVNRMGGGLISVAGGPVVSDVDSLLQIYNRFRRDLTDPSSHHKNGTFGDLWPDLAHFGVRHIPFANLVYLKGTLDYLMFYHLYEAASPGWWDRTNRRVQREQGRTMTGYTPGGGVPVGVPGIYLQNAGGHTSGALGGIGPFGAH